MESSLVAMTSSPEDILFVFMLTSMGLLGIDFRNGFLLLICFKM